MSQKICETGKVFMNETFTATFSNMVENIGSMSQTQASKQQKWMAQ